MGSTALAGWPIETRRSQRERQRRAFYIRVCEWLCLPLSQHLLRYRLTLSFSQASVMVEYSYDEAVALLESNLATALDKKVRLWARERTRKRGHWGDSAHPLDSYRSNKWKMIQMRLFCFISTKFSGAHEPRHCSRGVTNTSTRRLLSVRVVLMPGCSVYSFSPAWVTTTCRLLLFLLEGQGLCSSKLVTLFCSPRTPMSYLVGPYFLPTFPGRLQEVDSFWITQHANRPPLTSLPHAPTTTLLRYCLVSDISFAHNYTATRPCSS